MASTTTYDWPLERKGEPPGHTLRVDDAFSPTTLGEAIDQEVKRVEGVISDLEASLATRPGWHTIASLNLSSNGTPSVDIPSGTYDMIRINATGAITGGGENVAIRVNGDSTADLYRFSWYVIDPSVPGFDGNNADVIANIWPIGKWGTNLTCNVECTIYKTIGNNNLSFRSKSWQGGTGTSALDHGHFGGNLASPRLLSSIQFLGTNGLSISSGTEITVEGHRPIP